MFRHAVCLSAVLLLLGAPGGPGPFASGGKAVGLRGETEGTGGPGGNTAVTFKGGPPDGSDWESGGGQEGGRGTGDEGPNVAASGKGGPPNGSDRESGGSREGGADEKGSVGAGRSEGPHVPPPGLHGEGGEGAEPREEERPGLWARIDDCIHNRTRAAGWPHSDDNATFPHGERHSFRAHVSHCIKNLTHAGEERLGFWDCIKNYTSADAAEVDTATDVHEDRGAFRAHVGACMKNHTHNGTWAWEKNDNTTIGRKHPHGPLPPLDAFEKTHTHGEGEPRDEEHSRSAAGSSDRSRGNP